MADTSIQWTQKVWNCLRGCSRVSPGCGGAAGIGGCYAEKTAHRFSGPGMPYEGLVRLGSGGPRWTGDMRLVPEKLDEPLRWKRPVKIFVNSMSDLFHKDVPREYIAAVFGVMAACPQHTFQVLTKRADRLPKWFEWLRRESLECNDGRGMTEAARCLVEAQKFSPSESLRRDTDKIMAQPWPLPNVWLGVSVEDQQNADARIPELLEAPAAVRFLSCEPLLGPIDLFAYLSTPLRDESLAALGASKTMPGIDWAIIGGESGGGARRFDVAWARKIIQQCKEAGVPAFMKQMGAFVVDRNDAGFDGSPEDAWNLNDPDTDIEHDLDGTRDGYQGAPVRIRLRDSRHGGDIAEFPKDLQVRQFPVPA